MASHNGSTASGTTPARAHGSSMDSDTAAAVRAKHVDADARRPAPPCVAKIKSKLLPPPRLLIVRHGERADEVPGSFINMTGKCLHCVCDVT